MVPLRSPLGRCFFPPPSAIQGGVTTAQRDCGLRTAGKAGLAPNPRTVPNRTGARCPAGAASPSASCPAPPRALLAAQSAARLCELWPALPSPFPWPPCRGALSSVTIPSAPGRRRPPPHPAMRAVGQHLTASDTRSRPWVALVSLDCSFRNVLVVGRCRERLYYLGQASLDTAPNL